MSREWGSADSDFTAGLPLFADSDGFACEVPWCKYHSVLVLPAGGCLHRPEHLRSRRLCMGLLLLRHVPCPVYLEMGGKEAKMNFF